MTKNEINEVLAAEWTKRTPEELKTIRDEWRACDAGIVNRFQQHRLFTDSFDTLVLLEELLTNEERKQYVMSLPFSALALLKMSPLNRARALAEVLGGET